MAGAAQDETVRGRPPSALTPIPQMMHVVAASAARPTPAAIATPDRGADRADRLRQGGPPFALHDDARFRFGEVRHRSTYSPACGDNGPISPHAHAGNRDRAFDGAHHTGQFLVIDREVLAG